MSYLPFLRIKKTASDRDLQERQSKLAGDEELMSKIFKHLHGADLKNCRLVCRKWRNCAQGQFKKEMTIIIEDNRPFLRWQDVSHRTRSFEAFFRDFEGCAGRIPLNSFKLNNNYYALRSDHWAMKWLDEFGTNIENLTVIVSHSDSDILMNQLWALRNLIFMKMQNVENLNLNFIFSAQRSLPTNGNYDCIDYPFFHHNIKKIKLKNLKRIKYSVVTPKLEQGNIVAEVLFDFMYAAKNLDSLDMHLLPYHINALLRIPRGHLKNFKELNLTDSECSSDESCQSMEQLGDASKILKLRSFSLQCSFKFYEYQDIGDVLLRSKFLLAFLEGQKDYLQRFRIIHPPFPVFTTDDEDRFGKMLKGQGNLVFPKMAKLEALLLGHSYRNFSWLFSGLPNFFDFFPKLKFFQYHYIIEKYNSLFPRLLKNIDIPCESVTEVTVSINSFIPGRKSSEHADKEIQTNKLFRLMKEKFPNLKRLEVLGGKPKLFGTGRRGGMEAWSYFPNTFVLSPDEDQNSEIPVVNKYRSLTQEQGNKIQRQRRVSSAQASASDAAMVRHNRRESCCIA